MKAAIHMVLTWLWRQYLKWLLWRILKFAVRELAEYAVHLVERLEPSSRFGGDKRVIVADELSRKFHEMGLRLPKSRANLAVEAAVTLNKIKRGED